MNYARFLLRHRVSMHTEAVQAGVIWVAVVRHDAQTHCLVRLVGEAVRVVAHGKGLHRRSTERVVVAPTDQ